MRALQNLEGLATASGRNVQAVLWSYRAHTVPFQYRTRKLPFLHHKLIKILGNFNCRLDGFSLFELCWKLRA